MPRNNNNPNIPNQVGNAARRYFTNEIPRNNGQNSAALNTTGRYGIINAEIDTTIIPDQTTERGADLGKIGSSMPSPLARLFLFSVALDEVNALEAQNPRSGHCGKLNDQGVAEPTAYHDMVGELLDMLEFVFTYGDDPDFKVERWDLGAECRALNASNFEAHKRLASALESAFQYGVLQGQPIYIFKWKDLLIGGTSPISVVYTSANLHNDHSQKKYNFTGKAGNRLFVGNALPLHSRDEAFIHYICNLRYLISPNSPLHSLSVYIRDSFANYVSTHHSQLHRDIENNPGQFTNVKNLQTDGGANVVVAGVPIKVSNNVVQIDSTTTDYILKPSIPQNGNVPMVLTKYGEDRLKYAGRNWNPDSDIIDALLPSNINDRVAPGLRSKYPFLTVSDFFEDKVVEVSYQINKEKFFTGSNRDTTFLLPLKKVFFDYFSKSDLFDSNGRYTDMLVVEYDSERHTMTCRLKLPLVNGHTLNLTKTYDTSDDSKEKVNCYDSSNTFNFAVFPFYRLQPDTQRNVYNVMVGRTLDDVSLEFYEMENGRVNSQVVTRTRKGTSSQLSTDHIHVEGAFTFIEVSIAKATKALVLPILKEVNSQAAQAQREFVFSIDFGTTNTHVSYVNIVRGKEYAVKDVQAFEYGDGDAQMVVFNDNNGSGEFISFATALKREFVPATLGDNIKFPMRTATFESSGLHNVLKMFENTNIGFNYTEDISRSENYKTNIKWDRFDGNAKDRMSIFFEQMLWMMKNKSVLNDCSDSFKVIVTYPISMRPRDLKIFEQAWANAKAKVRCNVAIFYRTESVAPYYSYLSLPENNYDDPYVNMDIGGGTTDMLYVNPYSGESSVFSAFFAADDIWGDGTERAKRANKANGLLSYYKNKRMTVLGDNITEVRSVIEKASSSADIISYLFAKDWSRFADTIGESPEMMQIPVIHFSALTFYLAYSLYVAEVEAPRRLTFTGMGSKYINLISPDERDISKLVNAIFHYVGEKFKSGSLSNANVIVSFAPNPKVVTANGALVSLCFNNPINPSEDIYYGYKDENTGRTLRYADITNDIQDRIIEMFGLFVDMFGNEEVSATLSDIGNRVGEDVVASLRQNAQSSFVQMKDSSSSGQEPSDRLKEPMFFWPLKNSLYKIGIEIAQRLNNNSQTNTLI